MSSLRIQDQHLPVIRKMAQRYKPLYDAGWLDTGNASVAFLVCISQGPWQQDRRFGLAERAIDELIRSTSPHTIDLRFANIPGLEAVFPLRWQKNFVRRVIEGLRTRRSTMHEISVDWLERKEQTPATEDPPWDEIARELFVLAGTPGGSKVLWMFCRDFLQVPAFTIDRWVARRLREHGLPTNPWYMTRACLKAGVDPNELSRGLFSSRDNA